MENFSAYLANVSSSSSSSDNEDIPFSLYNIDLAYDLSVQRSSSFSQVRYEFNTPEKKKFKVNSNNSLRAAFLPICLRPKVST
jgi:hypothetical protein